MTLYLFNFNNYYNRIVKRYTTLEEYNANGINLIGITGVNFNPNDGIYTKQVVNYNGEDMPDYLIVADEYGNIISRWYIIESRRTRGGQFEMELYRDVIAEWYDEVINAPCFIEKATVGMYDTAIFNNEDMTFNQIKTSETLIKDKAGCGWYVGYAAANTDAITLTVKSPAVTVSGTYNNFEEYSFNNYASEYAYDKPYNKTFVMFLNGPRNQGTGYGWDKDNNSKTPIFDYISGTANTNPNPYIGFNGTSYPGIISSAPSNGFTVSYESFYPQTLQKLIIQALLEKNIDWEDNSNSIIGYNSNRLSELEKEVGKVYSIGGSYYRIRLNRVPNLKRFAYINNASGYASKLRIIAKRVSEISPAYTLTAADTTIVGSIEWECDAYQLVYDNVTSDYTIDVPLLGVRSDNAIVNINTRHPYKMFAIPYGDIKVAFAESGYYNVYTCNREFARELVRQAIIALGEKLYDIQLLPYLPVDDFHIHSDGIINRKTFLPQDPINVDQSYFAYEVRDLKAYCHTFILYPNSYETKRIIRDHNIPIAVDSISQKVQNCCDKYRLVSPNYNGQFEFSAAKNYGVTSWNVVQSCKPYQPYIRVSPNFNGLYGSDFEDARGLICGGDFSITQYESAWVNYQIQNKNYQVMFDRQIQNMEVNNSVQRTQDIVGAIAGTVQGAASGALAGFASGNVPGAIAGSVAGGVTSGIAGAADVMLNEKLRKEALDYTKDQFGYSLQNIQALPHSLTKVGTQNADFKLFPFIEYFTCTEIEKTALKNKIKYNGMTVMRIGQISDFIQPERSYIKGKLIRLENLPDDFHVINAISKEINEGVFI